MMMEAKSENVTYNFGLTSHVILKRGNGNKEIAGRWQNNSLRETSNVFWVLNVKLRIEKHCLGKQFACLKNVCY